ncbi:MAG: tRNA (adenosine(37)-N6)-threonylcarbamoyltransferase complex dimerization subunit type 1 TsaB [Betaproteobacteria bacterium]
MKILALETSTEFCSVALWHDGEMDAIEHHVGQGHSERLLGMVAELLRRHDTGVQNLDGIAYGEGPGSFTGLRIACGVTQGLAFAAGIPVVGVGTLMAMAECAQAERVICCMDARMHEIYHAAYERRAGGWHAACAPGVYAPRAAPPVAGGGWLGCGNAFSVYGELLTQRYDGQLAGVAAAIHPRAHEVARLAAPRFEHGEGRDAAAVAPLYVRDKVALKVHEQR